MPLLPQRVTFGAQLRVLRTARGWSQEEFAHRADLARTYVSGVERGVRNPTLDVITKFARTLEVEVADLFPRSGNVAGTTADRTE